MKYTISIIVSLLLSSSVIYSQTVNFFWSGAVTSSSFEVKAQISNSYINARLLYSKDSLFSVYKVSSSQVSYSQNNNIVTFKIENLNPSQQYYYRFSLNHSIDTTLFGKCKTFSEALDTFTIALGSCSWTGSNHPVFETIRQTSPLLFLHMGDIHYENIGINDIRYFQSAFNRVLNSPTQSKLYQQIPIAYMWDDHDYGPNNSDSTSPSREAARFTYRQYVPHFPLVENEIDKAIYHSFSIGRVKFIMCDSRSARSPANAVDDENKTMLGATQKAWFKQQLVDGRDNYALTVWVNTLPWIGVTGDDGWYLYTHERKELSNFIQDNNIQNLCMVSGDAHMIAIDDGTNSNYADSGGNGFPVLHAASLHRTPGVKGGPYSHGAFPGIGQFGTMQVSDLGDAISVHWKGLNYLNELIVAYSFSYPVNILSSQSTRVHPDTLYSYLNYPDRADEIELLVGNFNQSKSALDVDLSSVRVHNLVPLDITVENDSLLFQDTYLRIVVSYNELVSQFLPFYNSSQTTMNITGAYLDGSLWYRQHDIYLEGNLIGDLNYDRLIDMQDILVLVNYMFTNGSIDTIAIADVTEDSLIDISDLVLMVESIF